MPALLAALVPLAGLFFFAEDFLFQGHSIGSALAVAALVTVMAGALVLPFCCILRRAARRQIELSDSGIAVESGEQRTELSWREIGRQRDSTTGQRTVLEDFTGRVRIAVDYQLEGFEEIREAIHRKLSHLRASERNLFPCEPLPFGAKLPALGVGGFGVVALARGEYGAAAAMLGISGLVYFWLLEKPREVEVLDGGIEIRSPLRTRRVPFASVAAAEVRTFSRRVSGIPFREGCVLVTLTGGEKVVLDRLSDGPDVVLAAIERRLARWRERSGAAPPS